MKDNVCKRTPEQLFKALESMQECNKKTANKLREERRKYQKLYADYIKLKRRLEEWERLY